MGKSKGSRRERIAAYHEAGHAVIASIVERAFTAVVLDDTGGAFQFSRADTDFEVTATGAHRELLVVLGGMAVESLRFGHYYQASCASDQNQAVGLAQRGDSAASACLWGWAFERAQDIVAERWPAVRIIAEELKRLRRIDSRRVREIVGSAPLCQVVYRVPIDYAEHRQRYLDGRHDDPGYYVHSLAARASATSLAPGG